MVIDDFVHKFAEQFDETDKSSIGIDTRFREIEEWDSLHALSLIAMVDAEYQITITGEDISNSQSVRDLYEIVKARRQ